MSSNLVAAAIFGALMFSSTAGSAQTQIGRMMTVPRAPIGHLQPHAERFSVQSPEETVEQQKMSTFDAEQDKLDRQLDKSLNICRC